MSARPIPTIPGHWLTGNTSQLAGAPHRFVARVGLENGGLARFRILHKTLVACSSASAARHVLIKRHDNYPRSYHRFNGQLIVGNGLIFNEGEDWLNRRRILLPPFRPENMGRVVEVSAAETRSMLDEWAVQTEPVVAQTYAHRLTLAVISNALLSARLSTERADQLSASLKKGMRLIRNRNVSPLPLPLWVPTSANKGVIDVRDTLDEFANEHISKRSATPKEDWPDDILTHMMRAKDPATGQPLTHQNLLDETKTLFGAGYETTATTLTWCLYLLAKHPEVAAKWHAEVEEKLGGREPVLDDLNSLEYTASIVHESLRLYPSVYTAGRTAQEDDVIDGLQVHKGDTVLISIFGAHRDPAAWEDPERFHPERAWNKDAFMPFLVGKHRCIGNTFAHVELMVALAMIGQRFSVSLPEDFVVGEHAFITLSPDRDIPLQLTPRP